MSAFWKIISKIVDIMKITGAVFLMGMVVLTCVDVIGRFFGRPIFGSIELVIFMATLSVATALPYTHQVKAHIGVEILVRLFSEKVQTVMDLFTGFLSLGLFALVTWRMAVYAHTIQKSGEVSMSLEFPEYILIYCVSFCFLIFFFLIIRDIRVNFAKLKGEECRLP